MADLKISALTASTTPLAGTEVLPIVQSSTTKQVSVANLTAGRAVTMSALGVGVAAPSTGAYVTVNPSGVPSSTVASTNMWVVGADSSVNTVLYDAFNTVNLIGRRANGTFAAPTGIVGNTIFAIGARGYGATGYSAANRAQMSMVGSETWSDTAQGAQINFATTAIGGTTLTTRMTIGNAGDVTVSSGNLVIGTDGKGIDFAITPGTGTSELLNDYEEGTWTPVVVGSSTAGTGTYSLQSGLYTKVGRQVNVSLVLAWSAHTGTGTMSVTGLPFTNTATVASIPSLIAFNLTLTALNTLVGRIGTSATSIDILEAPVGGGAWGGVAIDTNVDALIISASYIV